MPPLGATVMATPAGDPVPVGAPHVEVAPVGVQVQVAPAASRGGSGSGSEKAPDSGGAGARVGDGHRRR